MLNSVSVIAWEYQVQLMKHYLGNITWEELCIATGIDFHKLPDKTEDVIRSI